DRRRVFARGRQAMAVIHLPPKSCYGSGAESARGLARKPDCATSLSAQYSFGAFLWHALKVCASLSTTILARRGLGLLPRPAGRRTVAPELCTGSARQIRRSHATSRSSAYTCSQHPGRS